MRQDRLFGDDLWNGTRQFLQDGLFECQQPELKFLHEPEISGLFWESFQEVRDSHYLLTLLVACTCSCVSRFFHRMQNTKNFDCLRSLFPHLEWILKRNCLEIQEDNEIMISFRLDEQRETKKGFCVGSTVPCVVPHQFHVLKRFLLQTLCPLPLFLMKPSETWVLRCPLSSRESEGITGPWVCCLINSKSWLLFDQKW